MKSSARPRISKARATSPGATSINSNCSPARPASAIPLRRLGGSCALIDEAQPWQGKKKGADTGIDGIRYFRDLDRKEVHTALIIVKGGENVGPTMVKDLIATLARDKADIGLFITLAAPTKAMLTEAAAAGCYESPNGKKYARLQILTIAGLLSGAERGEHPDYEPDTGYKKAKAEKHGEQKELTL